MIFSSKELMFFCIYQADREMEIDGYLREWEKAKFFSILHKPDGEKISPSEDISVRACFAFDLNNFYAAVSVKDDIFEFPLRSWRYGDGFYLTFVGNKTGEPETRFYSYGFSKVGNRLEKVLVNRNGVYFPPVNMSDVNFALRSDTQRHTINYELAIPWKYISPFKPLIHRALGINLTYVDRDGNKRKILQLFPDSNFDTELSNKRKGARFIFITRVPPESQKVEFQSCISANHLFSDQALEVQFAVNAGEDKKNCIVRTTLLKGDTAVERSEKRVDVTKGMNLFCLEFPLTGADTGKYLVKNEFLYSMAECEASVDEKEKIFILNREWFDSFKEEIKDFHKFPQPNQHYRASIPVAEIRYQWIDQYMKESASHSDIDELISWFKELTYLCGKLSKGEPALFDNPGIHRYAHRSQIDRTLQPYSLYLPSAFDPERSCPLIVALHGSGVDERGIIRFYSRIFPDWPILAPQARGLSDWYLGKSSEDVMECVEHVNRLFPLDRNNIFLLGFSMGGYGVWRIGLLYPDKFKALIIIAGSFQPPPYKKGENMIEFLDRARGKSILVVHGALDNAIPVAQIRPGIIKLKGMGINVDYWEIKGAAHGDFKPEVWRRVREWIKKRL